MRKQEIEELEFVIISVVKDALRCMASTDCNAYHEYVPVLLRLQKKGAYLLTWGEEHGEYITGILDGTKRPDPLNSRQIHLYYPRHDFTVGDAAGTAAESFRGLRIPSHATIGGHREEILETVCSALDAMYAASRYGFEFDASQFGETFDYMRGQYVR